MVLPTGVFVPTLAFFLDTPAQEVDLPTTAKHAIFLAKAGVAGLTVHGTTGEPALLSREEKRAILKCTREALDGAGFKDLPIVSGVGVSSTWETIDLCKEAASLGANYALVVGPGMYKGAMTDDALEAYFVEVADASPIPVLLYNFPGISNGLDLDVPLIRKLAKHNNIVGIKLSCGSVGKAARLTSLFSPSEFAVYGGLADTLLHGLMASGTLGAVSGLGNIAPHACVRVVKLFQEGKIAEAQKAQGELSMAGEIELKGGVPGMRAGLVRYHQYGGVCRRPIPQPTEALKTAVEGWIGHLMDRENL
ncbi:dihydrodipicolinate synthetase family protein [Mrakia frigida]|uniref:dihydrodipicolinate synthase family protein n=1 Tax=Mrakia frigida TaxID=29902 RepID=UPI003FCC047D